MGHSPFRHGRKENAPVDKIKERVLNEDFFKNCDRWMKFSAPLKDIICGCLQKDRTKRLTIQQIREHSWFKTYSASYINKTELELQHERQGVNISQRKTEACTINEDIADDNTTSSGASTISTRKNTAQFCGIADHSHPISLSTPNSSMAIRNNNARGNLYGGMDPNVSNYMDTSDNDFEGFNSFETKEGFENFNAQYRGLIPTNENAIAGNSKSNTKDHLISLTN